MRIAIPYADGMVNNHFSKTARFKLYEVEGDKLLLSLYLDVPETGHDKIPKFLKANGVDLVICNGIGGPAQQGLMNEGILFKGGCGGEVDGVIKAYLETMHLGLTGGSCSRKHEKKCGHHAHPHPEGKHCAHHGHHHDSEHCCHHKK